MTNTYSILVNVNGSDLKKIEIVPREDDNTQLDFKIIDVGEDTTHIFNDTEEVDLSNQSDEPIEQHTIPTFTPAVPESEKIQTSQQLETGSTTEYISQHCNEPNGTPWLLQFAAVVIAGWLFLLVLRIIAEFQMAWREMKREERWW